MGCGCGEAKTTGGALTLRCIDRAGCEVLPWGFRAYGETYTLPGGLACDLEMSCPGRFQIINGEYDLQAIRGIGPETEKALQALGIMTLRDLAQADVPEIDAHLDGANAEDIMAWQVQASSLLEVNNG